VQKLNRNEFEKSILHIHRWYGHVLRKDDSSEWVKKCMDFVVEGVRPREQGRK